MRPRAQTIARQRGFKSLDEVYWFIDEQYAYVGHMSAGEGTGVDVLRALAVGADAIKELARLAKQPIVRTSFWGGATFNNNDNA